MNTLRPLVIHQSGQNDLEAPVVGPVPRSETGGRLTGLNRADAGEAFLLGERVPCPARLRDVGAMVEEPAFYPWLSGRRNLQVLADTGAPVTRAAVGEALERAGLATVREFGDTGTTVFLSSHLLGEVERVCDRVAIVDRGRLVEVGSTSELGRGEERVRVVVRPQDETAALTLLAGWQVSGRGAGILLGEAGSGREVNQVLARGGVLAESIVMDRSGLEERFLAITQGETDSAAAPR